MKSIIINFFKKHGRVFALIALAVTKSNVNMACFWMNNQPKLPDKAKELRKF